MEVPIEDKHHGSITFMHVFIAAATLTPYLQVLPLALKHYATLFLLGITRVNRPGTTYAQNFTPAPGPQDQETFSLST